MNQNPKIPSLIACVKSVQFIAVNVSTSDKSSTSNNNTDIDDDIDDYIDYDNDDDNMVLANHGYLRNKTICNTFQGQIFEAELINNNHQRVVIKKTDKILHENRIGIEDGMNFILEENIVSEAAILKHLSVDNNSMGHCIIKYIDFFESQSDYYLVMECIENSINLQDFVKKCHQYIKQKKLKIKQYQKIIKYILWQLTVTLDWLHNDMHCCNLNVCIENVILKDADFEEELDGQMSVNPNFSVKLHNFGCSEIFNDDTFKCIKSALSIDNEIYLAPNICDGYWYDGRAVDIWSLGMIFYELSIGKKPYQRLPVNINTIRPGTGYWAIYKEKLSKYLKQNNLTKYINEKDGTSILLKGLLKIDESQRFNSTQILKNKYFKSYYKAYRQRIEEKRNLQREQLLNQQNKMDDFPYYCSL